MKAKIIFSGYSKYELDISKVYTEAFCHKHGISYTYGDISDEDKAIIIKGKYDGNVQNLIYKTYIVAGEDSLIHKLSFDHPKDGAWAVILPIVETKKLSEKELAQEKINTCLELGRKIPTCLTCKHNVFRHKYNSNGNISDTPIWYCNECHENNVDDPEHRVCLE